MRVQVLLIPSIMIILLVLTSACMRGDSRHEQTLNPKLSPQLKSISVSGPRQASLVVDKGWTITDSLQVPNRDLRITTDGGQTWQLIPLQAIDGALECAIMTGNRGWAINFQSQLFTTDSGGVSWTMISDHEVSSSGDLRFSGATQIEFVSEADAWILGGLSIWRSSDGGVRWHSVLSPSTPGVKGQPSSMFPIDANTLISAGSDGQVYLTRDGGETWKIQTPLAGNVTFSDVWFRDSKHGWLTGYAVLVAGQSLRPLLYQTSDGGETWQESPVPDSQILPSSVCFVGEEGWLAGNRRLVSGERVTLEGALLHTNDGGKHWTPVLPGSNPDEYLNEVRFSDKDHGWLVGLHDLYHTEDGGKTWKRVLSLPPSV